MNTLPLLHGLKGPNLIIDAKDFHLFHCYADMEWPSVGNWQRGEKWARRHQWGLLKPLADHPAKVERPLHPMMLLRLRPPWNIY